MPSGVKLTEKDRLRILNLVAHERLTFEEIATATGFCARTVAIVVREYAAFHRRRELDAQRIDDLIYRNQHS